MAKFYVNEVHDQTLTDGLPYRQSIIGLFEQCETDGRGSFCGYYGSEYYLDTKLYAYYVADCKGVYRPEARISDLTICNPAIKYREIQIGSHMWTSVIEAETIDEAIELFRDAEWRRWSSPFDELGMIPINPCPRCGQKPSVYYHGGRNVEGLICCFECEECNIRTESSEGTLDTANLWNDLVSKLEVK